MIGPDADGRMATGRWSTIGEPTAVWQADLVLVDFDQGNHQVLAPVDPLGQGNGCGYRVLLFSC